MKGVSTNSKAIVVTFPGGHTHTQRSQQQASGARETKPLNTLPYLWHPQHPPLPVAFAAEVLYVMPPTMNASIVDMEHS